MTFTCWEEHAELSLKGQTAAHVIRYIFHSLITRYQGLLNEGRVEHDSLIRYFQDRQKR
jgi:hypothetical protein